jgi:hypothetical protein
MVISSMRGKKLSRIKTRAKTKCTEHNSGIKPNKSTPRGHAVMIVTVMYTSLALNVMYGSRTLTFELPCEWSLQDALSSLS